MNECSWLTHSRMEAQSLFTPLPAPPSPPPVYHSPTPKPNSPIHYILTHTQTQKRDLETNRVFIPFCQLLPTHVAWIHYSYRKKGINFQSRCNFKSCKNHISVPFRMAKSYALQ